MILTGLASAITLGGTQLTSLGEFTLKIAQDAEEYSVLSNAASLRIPTFKSWEVDIKLKGTLPARSYGAVSVGTWNGLFLKDWKVAIKGDVSEAPQQANAWIDRSFGGYSWDVESSKFVDSSTKHVFLRAVVAANGLATITTPILSGLVSYGDAETAANQKPMEEKLSFPGSDVFTAGAYFTSITNKFLNYGTALLSQGYVTPESLIIANRLTGSAYLSEFSVDSDGKALDLTVKLLGHGTPTLL